MSLCPNSSSCTGRMSKMLKQKIENPLQRCTSPKNDEAFPSISFSKLIPRLAPNKKRTNRNLTEIEKQKLIDRIVSVNALCQ